MFFVAYFSINSIILIVNTLGKISDTNSLILYLIMGIALFVLNINRTENMKHKAGIILIEVKPKFPNSKWVSTLISIGVFLLYLFF